jgi:cell division protein FtsI (penicillin-binding protein 3)
VKSRLAVLAALLTLWIGAIATRLWSLQVVRHDEFAARAERQQQRVVELDPPRGTIFDSQGRELAVSIEVESAFAVPREIGDVAAAASRLARVLDVDRAKLERQLSSDREFVWVARKLDPPLARAVRALNLSGIYFLEEAKRYYPSRRLAAHVLGYVGTDNQGLGGLEARYDATVAGTPGRRTVLRDARRGQALPPGLPSRAAVAGHDLYLTLDSALQQIAEEELASAVGRLRAKSGSVVLLDPDSGAVLAMASEPSFDPNEFRHASDEARKNRAIEDAFEPGSTFKMVTAASALETGVVSPGDRFDCEMGSITLAGVRIADHKPFGNLSLAEVIAKSSNVGTIKTALRVSNREFYDTIRAFGFGAKSGVDLPGESSGLLMPLEVWPPLAKAYISFGQGISVTPIELAAAFAAVANGGRLLEPYVVASYGSGADANPLHPEPVERGRPVSPRVVEQLRQLLAGVTVEGGTGRAAVTPGYTAAGKTGTAQKAVAGKGYLTDEHIASFVGWSPYARPLFVGIVVIDAPKGAYHGGEAAAPVFGAIARRSLLARGLRPERERPEHWPGEPARTAPQKQTVVADAAALEKPPPAPTVPPPGTFPDLAGKSAREAVAAATQLELVPVLRGKGSVVRQEPSPGAPLPVKGSSVLFELGLFEDDTGGGG